MKIMKHPLHYLYLIIHKTFYVTCCFEKKKSVIVCVMCLQILETDKSSPNLIALLEPHSRLKKIRL